MYIQIYSKFPILLKKIVKFEQKLISLKTREDRNISFSYMTHADVAQPSFDSDSDHGPWAIRFT